jgi:hypothetical protein
LFHKDILSVFKVKEKSHCFCRIFLLSFILVDSKSITYYWEITADRGGSSSCLAVGFNGIGIIYAQTDGLARSSLTTQITFNGQGFSGAG